jgi:hypothetical protein
MFFSATCATLSAVASLQADQQVIFPPESMPRVDMHTHMDAKDQYDKCVAAMDQWGGTISITLAGLFWVKDNEGNKASPASVRQIPGNDMVHAKEKLNERILFVPGAFTIPSEGIWWTVDEIRKFKEQGFFPDKLNVKLLVVLADRDVKCVSKAAERHADLNLSIVQRL